MKPIKVTDVLAAIAGRLKQETKYDVYHYVEEEAKPPFLFLDLVGIRHDDSTKVSIMETYDVAIHGITPKKESKGEIYTLMHDVELAMSEAIELGEGYRAFPQKLENGIPKIDETGEWHATLLYPIKIYHFE